MSGKLRLIPFCFPLIVLSLSILLVPHYAGGQSGVATGSVTSSADFLRAKDGFMRQLVQGQEGSFAYCVCTRDRGRIVYAHAVGADSGKATSDAVRKAASGCGGCYKNPVVRRLSPTSADTVRRTLPVWMTP
jgi:hypothetical protein